jgi:hypothetical protein
MDANKIKFVDDDGSVEVLEPPMTARVHVETPTEEHSIPETIEEEPSSESENVIIVSSSVDSSIEDLKSSVENLSGEILNSEAGEEVKEPLNEEVVLETRTEPKAVIEKVVEQHVKELEKMESVIASSVEAMQPPSAPFSEREQGSPEIIKIDEVKVPEKEEIDKEALSIVANAVQDIRAEEHKQITPKGCCILQ